MTRYTRQQWFTLIVSSTASLCTGACYSLQAPFYPRLAEEKGASPSQYGFVFGVFQLIAFITSPIFGKYINQIGPKFLYSAGIITTGFTCILFGFLNRVNDTNAFIGLSFAVRIVQGMGGSGYFTSSTTIIAKMFTENVGKGISLLETCFGFGMIVGPTVGGALFTLGGYTLPFVVVGVMLLTAAAISFCILPNWDPEDTVEDGNNRMIMFFKIPAVALASYTIIVVSCGIGFIEATLEPHLRPFELPPFQLSLMFVISGGVYAISAPLWGWLCDKKVPFNYLLIVGGLLGVAGFLLVGPAPFLPIPTTLPLCIGALVCQGLANGAELIVPAASSLHEALARGLPDDIGTYGLLGAMVTSCFSLGAFIGPSVGGVLLDWVGFEWGTMFMLVLNLSVMLMYGLHLHCSKNPESRPQCPRQEGPANNDGERTPLLTSDRISPPQSHSNHDSSYYSTTPDSS